MRHITVPLLFGKLINTGEASQAAVAIFVGAAVMAIGGIAEALFGVKSEGEKLEDIAPPLTGRCDPGRGYGAGTPI